MRQIPQLTRCLAAAAVFTIALLVNGLNSAGPKAGGKEGPEWDTSDNWHMFGGTPARNFVNLTAKGLPVEWSVEAGDLKNTVWSADLGSKAYGGPIVFDGRVFIGTNNQKPRDKKWMQDEVKDGKKVLGKDGKPRRVPIDLGIIMAFDQKKGDFLYQIVFEKLKAGRVNDWPEEGICSTPYVDGDRMYFVSNRCEVVCADTKTGKAEWKLDMIDKLGVFPHNIAVCSPLIVGDYLWVVTANGVDEGHINVPAPKAPSFIKLNKKDGKVLWQYNGPTIRLTEKGEEEGFFKRLIDRGELIQHGQWSNPAYGVAGGQKQVIFPGGDGWIYSFDPDTDKLLWKFDCNPKDAQYHLSAKGTRNDFIATPVVYKERVYIGVGQDPEHETNVGHLWCIDMNKRGDVSPDLVTDAAVFPPKTKPNPNSAKVWHYGGFTTPEDKAKLKRNYYFGRTMSTCAIKDDVLYVGELLGYIHCLDANTGKVFWTHDTGGPLWSSPYYADNKVYIGNDAGTVLVFAHGKTKKILQENDMGGRVRATPVAVGDTLYVMTENRLWALRNKKE
ncbi:MAG: PQQ-binding-like beta-propeller repeat protein [Gemmataceae bacterium]